MKLICLTGLSGSGKSTVKSIFDRFAGLQSFYTRELTGNTEIEHKWQEDVLISDMNQHGNLSSDPNHFIRTCFDILLKRIKPNTKTVVFDSLRSPHELRFVKTEYHFEEVLLVHVTCNDELRFERLKIRDNVNNEMVKLRDNLDLGKAHDMQSLFQLADFKIDTSDKLCDTEEKIIQLMNSSNHKTNKPQIEFEVKYRIDSDTEIDTEKLGLKSVGSKHQIDTYYVVNEEIEGKRTYIRLREDLLKNKGSFDHHAVIDKYSTEEKEVALTLEDVQKMKGAFMAMGQEIKCVVDKKRTVYKNGEIQLMIDEVKGLGIFLEIEIVSNEDEKDSKIDLVKKMALELRLNPENAVLGMGYPDMFS